MRREITIRFIVLVTLSSVFSLQVVGQTAVDMSAAEARVKAARAVVQKKIHTTPRVGPVRPVVIQQGANAPQVVTILHGLNGRKLFRMLLRSNELAAIAKLDKSFQIENEIHTNVIAGLALAANSICAGSLARSGWFQPAYTQGCSGAGTEASPEGCCPSAWCPYCSRRGSSSRVPPRAV